jgi:hypothetical protein
MEFVSIRYCYTFMGLCDSKEDRPQQSSHSHPNHVEERPNRLHLKRKA